MLDSIINAFLEFKWFMLLNVGLTIAAGVILWFATEQFGYQRKNRYLFAFFMGMKNREILWTGFAWTQMVFILSCVILGGEMNLVYLVFLLLLVPARFLLYQDIRRLPVDLVNAVLLYLALLVGSVMRDYLKTIRFDSLILLVLILQIIITQFGAAVFETVPLSVGMWGKMLLTAFTVIILNEVVKAVKRLLGRK